MITNPKKVFLSYAREDFETANKLYHDLTNTGVDVWFDQKELLPGQDWKLEITQAIKESACFLAVTSSNSISKRGYVQNELRIAVAILDELPPSEIFIIPVRLDNCIPSHDKLKDYQWADLFPSYQKGLANILRALSLKGIIIKETKPNEIIDDDDESHIQESNFKQKTQNPSSLNELLRQNGYEYVKQTVEDEIFSDAIDVFTKLILNHQLFYYLDGENGGFKWELFEHKNGKGRIPLRPNEIDFDKLNSFTPNEAFLSVLNSLPQGFRFLKDGRFNYTEFKDNESLRQTIQFLAGGWLEDYIQRVLKSGFTEKTTEINRNLRISRYNWGIHARDFEIDFVILKNYKLLGISCTTSKKISICKSKGFEISIRAKQIGGRDSKAVLITCLGEAHRDFLEDDLRIEADKKNIIVLGIDDLEEAVLLRKIQNFIQD